jgi:hypothetical protein
MRQPIAQRTARAAGIIASLLLATVVASAQQVVSAKAGLVQYIEGIVFLKSDVALLQKDFVQMENGQILRTRKGRAEVLLAPDIYLRLDENGSIRMEQNQLEDTRLVLESGSALIEVVLKRRGNPLKVRFITGIVEIKKAGLYRLDVGSGELRIYGGEALIAKGDRKVTVKTGRKVRLETDLRLMEFDVNASDSLHEWAAQRSFNLFIATADTRRQLHWKPISLGWLMNFDFRKRFYSELFFDHWSDPYWMQHEEEKEREARAREEEKARLEAEHWKQQ